MKAAFDRLMIDNRVIMYRNRPYEELILSACREAASAMSVMPDVTTAHITSASGEISSFFAYGLGFFIYDLSSKEESKL